MTITLCGMCDWLNSIQIDDFQKISLKMEKDNLEISKYKEQIYMEQLWQFLTELCSKNLILKNDYIKQLLNLDNEDIIKDISNCMNKFDYLSESLFNHLSNLRQLDLSNNDLKDLPQCLHLLKDLEHLALNNNKFSYLPTVIGDWKALRSLKVHENYIEEIPENIGNLADLEYLNLSFNKLTTLPDTCKKLHKLKYLSLVRNNFAKIPDCIVTGMGNLEMLDLSLNKRIILDIPLCSIHIKRFYARQNYTCPAFPKWIFSTKYYKLEEVSLDCTVFQKFDFEENVPSVSNIKKFSMIECKLSEKIIQMIMRKLKCLENISIGNNTRTSNGNSFWFLPIQYIEDKVSLKEISAPRTSIPMIPKCINKLEDLIIIDVSFNNITYLPEEVCYLKKLRTLIINNNSLVSLPDSIGQLGSLEKLKASHNQLTQLPRSMIYLNNLKFLDLYRNEFMLAEDLNINMTCLQGIDLEQNYLSSSDLPIMKSHYENLRFALLEQWNERSERVIGPQKIPTCDEDEFDYLSSSTNDSIEDIEVYEPSNLLELAEENWDDSDSADEFDPHVFKEPTCRSSFSYCDFVMLQQQFCPSDIHAEPIAKRIIRMICNGTLSWKIELEEGQFDDV